MQKIKLFKFLLMFTSLILLVGVLTFLSIYIFSIVFDFTPKERNLFSVFLILPSLLLLATMIRSYFNYSKIYAIFYTIFVFWAPIFLDIFIFSLFLVPVYLIFNLSFPYITLLYFFTFVVLFSLIYGFLNAKRIRIKFVEIQNSKLKENWQGKDIVIFSDVHLGLVRSHKFMEEIVNKVNKLNSSLVLILGDLIDGPVFPYEDSLKHLANIRSDYGVFYTAGNHDEYNKEPEKYYGVLSKYVEILNDKKVVVNGTNIIGLTYEEESVENTKNRLKEFYTKDYPSIVVLHDPKNTKALFDMGVDLSLSGHTHGGQFFPISFLVKTFYGKLTKGFYQKGDSMHFTSVGVGTAGPLFRLGNEPEIVVLKIK